MRVVAVFSVLSLSVGIPAMGQSTPPASALPQSASVVCTERLQPDNGKLGNEGTLILCTTGQVQGCPVDMRVRQKMSGGTVAVDENGVKRKVFAQRLRLILNSLRPGNSGQKAVSATVTVHGTSGTARLQPLGPVSNHVRDLSSGSMVRTLRVGLGDWGDQGVSGDFFLPGFTSASQVDLESVTYEDGTTWKLSNNESCRVAPDPLMLIER
jgi:hypothetical protein